MTNPEVWRQVKAAERDPRTGPRQLAATLRRLADQVDQQARPARPATPRTPAPPPPPPPSPVHEPGLAGALLAASRVIMFGRPALLDYAVARATGTAWPPGTDGTAPAHPVVLIIGRVDDDDDPAATTRWHDRFTRALDAAYARASLIPDDGAPVHLLPFPHQPPLRADDPFLGFDPTSEPRTFQQRHAQLEWERRTRIANERAALIGRTITRTGARTVILDGDSALLVPNADTVRIDPGTLGAARSLLYEWGNEHTAEGRAVVIGTGAHLWHGLDGKLANGAMRIEPDPDQPNGSWRRARMPDPAPDPSPRRRAVPANTITPPSTGRTFTAPGGARGLDDWPRPTPRR